MPVRKLSKTELGGLTIGLDAINVLGAELAAALPAMLAAAEKESAVRQARGLPLPGPFGTAHRATTRALYRLALAREDTTTALDAGTVEKT